ncbi:MAG: hypothetical protein GOV00_04415 [Candidatus Altiarchaeota archaeon]|nr:hypothetical protein [Candidatus Altiarchaeota archaeon]
MYYPNYYWVQQNHYPQAEPHKKAWLPWAIIFILIMASFYTIYIYIQPEFILSDVSCAQNYAVAHFVMAKSGRFFMGTFKMDIAGKIYEKSLTSTVMEGDSLDVVFKVNLSPGSYMGDMSFRGEYTGDFECVVR